MGSPVVGVETDPQPRTRVGPSRAQAVLAMDWTPAASGLSILTAKKRVTDSPAGMLPTGSRQREPGPVPGQDQPAELAAASKAVWSGTVSVSWTPPAPRLPGLVAVMV